MFTFLMNHSAEVGLLLFFVCFVLITWFAATRARQELDEWANLPLAGAPSADAASTEEQR